MTVLRFLVRFFFAERAPNFAHDVLCFGNRQQREIVNHPLVFERLDRSVFGFQLRGKSAAAGQQNIVRADKRRDRRQRIQTAEKGTDSRMGRILSSRPIFSERS